MATSPQNKKRSDGYNVSPGTLDEIAAAQWHGCITGDCPHNDVRECVPFLTSELVRVGKIAESVNQAVSEFAWLIEDGQTQPSAPLYWAGGDLVVPWSRDNLLAVRFARRVDAERFVAGLGWKPDSVRIAEHGWSSMPRVPDLPDGEPANSRTPPADPGCNTPSIGVDNKKPLLIERLMRAQSAEAALDQLVYGMHVCEDWYYDTYDWSLEMLGTQNGWKPSAEQWEAIAAAGFIKLYVSYKDGSSLLGHTSSRDFGQCGPREPRFDKHQCIVDLEAARATIADLRAKLEEAAAKNERLHGRILELEQTIALGDKYVRRVGDERDQARAVLAKATGLCERAIRGPFNAEGPRIQAMRDVLAALRKEVGS